MYRQVSVFILRLWGKATIAIVRDVDDDHDGIEIWAGKEARGNQCSSLPLRLSQFSNCQSDPLIVSVIGTKIPIELFLPPDGGKRKRRR